MALARSWSVALVGLEAHVVEVEADLALGIPAVAITGLPDTSLGEARDRVRAAVVNSGFSFPQKRVTLGLSPAALPKRGSGFDLSLAAAVLAADRVVRAEALHGVLLLGELALDGRVRPVAGVLPALRAALDRGFPRAVVPMANLAEARLVPGLQVVGVSHLSALVDLLQGRAPEEQVVPPPPEAPDDLGRKDLADVRGQYSGRRALEVAAAGGHNLLMSGPPGCGKTLLAERLPTLLPPLSESEALEVTAIHSVAGCLPPGAPLVSQPPFQAPHHGTSLPALVGGGSTLARPGAASLAHRGILFLDEAPEFASGVLDALRQPLEQGEVVLRRVGGTARYPARFSLVLAANPCPCAKVEASCSCPPNRRRTYLSRLSGPLLDRIDVVVSLPAITRRELRDDVSRDSSAVVAARVAGAREAALVRYAGTPWRTNADVPAHVLARRWPVPKGALVLAAQALDRERLTARGYERVQRLAWTLADLGGRACPTRADVDEALLMRLDAPVAGAAA